MRLTILLVIPLLISCAGIEPIPEQVLSDTRACVAQVSQVETAKANNIAIAATTATPDQILLSSAINALAESAKPNPYEPCFEQIRAHYAAQQAGVQSTNAMYQTALGVAAVPVALWAGQGWIDSLMQGAAGWTINSSSSDIIIDSGTGEGSTVGRINNSNTPNVNTNTPVVVVPPIVPTPDP